MYVCGTSPANGTVKHAPHPDKAGGPLPWASSVRGLCFLLPRQTLRADAEPCLGDNACVYVCGTSPANGTVKHAPHPDKAGGPLPWASSVRRLCFLWPSSSFIPPHRTRLLRSLLEHSRMPKVSDISWSNGSKTAYSVRLTERLYCQYIRH